MSNQTKAAGGLSDPGRIKEVLSRHGFHFSKALGQNFLINPTVCPRMAQACGAGDCKGVIEVGPGIGVLTWELSQVAEKVCAIELDSRLFPVLEETLAGRDNVKIIPGDVMKLDLAQLIQEEFGGGPVCVCANLPYYITSPVILRLLEEGALPQQAPGAVPCGPGELYAPAQGGFRRHPPGRAAAAPRGGGGREVVLPGGPGGLCPAPQNRGQLHLRHAGGAQAPGGAGPAGRRGGRQHPRRAPHLGAARRPVEQLAALAGALGESLPLASRGKTV